MVQQGVIVAIDGPAGAGKSTVAKSVALLTGMTFVDTGAVYRTLAYRANAMQVAMDEAAALAKLTESLPIRFKMGTEGQKVYLDGADVTEAIREPHIGVWASQVSQHPSVRQGLLALQRKMGAGPAGAVLEGRDIGTVVFPQAQVKVFLTADPMERAKRRVAQLFEQGIVVSLDEVLGEMQGRDKRDQERAVAPLIKADDAVEIDSTKFTMDEVVQKIINLVTEARGRSS